ncbi:MAG: hypothetical protein ACRDA3_06420 [Peptostreptococcaceae bacterium]
MDNFNNSSNGGHNCNGTKNTSQKNVIGMQNWSYADFVVLSSVLAYAIAEELNDIDLDLFIVFLGSVQSDLATLRLQRGIRNNQNDIITEIDTTNTGVEDISSQILRSSKTKKVKKIRKKKYKRKSIRKD